MFPLGGCPRLKKIVQNSEYLDREGESLKAVIEKKKEPRIARQKKGGNRKTNIWESGFKLGSSTKEDPI